MRNLILIRCLMLAVLLFLLWGIGRIFNAEFQSGSAYPEYSSFRRDPLGIRILFESYEKLADIDAERNLKPALKAEDPSTTAALYAGVREDFLLEVDEPVWNAWQEFLGNGGKLIITLRDDLGPRTGLPARGGDDPYNRAVDALDEWGLQVQRGRSTEAALAKPAVEGVDLPETFEWREALFLKPDDEWTVVYESDQGALWAHRRLGAGEVTIIAGSYFLSNEGLVQSPLTAPLAWLVEGRTTVVFDEAHHGVVATLGVGSLLVRYRLGWFIAGVVAVAALFVWRNASSLIPRHRASVGEGAGVDVTGRSAREGLHSILRRSLSLGELLGVCWEEWKKDKEKLGMNPGEVERMAAVAGAASDGKRESVAHRYRELSRIRTERHRGDRLKPELRAAGGIEQSDWS